MDIAKEEWPAQSEMVRLNCEALTNMTLLCMPYLSQGSRILQIASAAAFAPQPQFAVYAATKSYVLSFSRALGAEWKKKGIYVTAVCPGPVDLSLIHILINSLQECYDVVRTNRAELESPTPEEGQEFSGEA